tara:strand:- start:10640 stop:11116 length:477 start_codon:yes stop_codon:yes gene_type:complete
MRDDEFDRMFGRKPAEPRPSFVERVTRGEALGGRVDAPGSMGPESETIGGSDGYRAFGMMPASQVHASCELRWWMEGTTVPEGLAFPYRLLMEVGFSGEDTLRLLLPDKVVEVVGAQLEPLRQGLMRQRVTFVQQWSAQVWRAKPTAEAVVTRISVAR